MTRLDYSTRTWVPIFIWVLIHGKPLHAGEWVLVFMGCLVCMGAESTVYPGTHGHLLRTVITLMEKVIRFLYDSYKNLSMVAKVFDFL